MEKLLNELVDRLRRDYGETLISVFLYGSAASGEFHEKFSDLNVLVVLKQLGVRELTLGQETVRWWQKQKQPLPLLLGREEVENSSDVFPIEFLDIQHNHRLLHGEDVVAKFSIDTHDHRRQVEHELRAALLRLRGRFLGLQQDKGDVARLMLDSVSTFATLFEKA
jgi:predicted nucleotidyltransferase